MIAGRFVVVQQAGRGGMGSIFQARDALSGRSIALKFMHSAADEVQAQRFTREAEILAEMRHPGIVTHVAHGSLENGQPFLAMEWLEGEDLSQRLSRQPLSLPETLLMLRRVAEALAAAHRRGIIHRDLKPSNLFLREGQVERMVVLDFGLAQHALSTRSTTGSTVVGTPGYMAPEQASCQELLTPSVDVFSLGCVLYECLTWQQPFKASHLVAALAKILFAEPPPLHSLRRELPPALQTLVDRMLAKDPQQRLPDAMAVLEALEGLELSPGEGRLEAGTRAGGLEGEQQQLVSALLVRPPDATQQERLSPEQQTLASTWVSPQTELLDSLRAMFSRHGAQVLLLADESLLVTLPFQQGAATDHAALAARCALSIKERWPQVTLVLCTGRGILGRQQPVGEVMDRVGQLLQWMEQQPTATPAHVLLDEVTAGLLGPSFQLGRGASGFFWLEGLDLDADASRLLLGRPTPCVGREQELSLLELSLSACVEEEAARALLVTAPAGVGKSRLRHEFLRRLEKQERTGVLLLGRGDPMRASAFGLLGQAVRRLCGIQAGDELERLRDKLRTRVGRHLPPAESKAIIEFLGELCDVPFPDEDSPQLRAARADSRALNTQVGWAFTSFLRAESAHGPVLLVLEDLHWSDTQTVQWVEEALRALASRPFLVLAFARPGVKERFPGLWGHHLQELPLRGLSSKACGRLVREVLGPEVPEAVTARVVQQAAGNALFLEELIRMIAEGKGETPPVTVLAMLQARIQRLEAGTRRVLLAASIFGPSFWQGGVKALLSPAETGPQLEEHLWRLVEWELIERQDASHFPSETEFHFRHALLRDAAYALVPDSQRAAGHQLAEAWLEQRLHALQDSVAVFRIENYQQGYEKIRAALSELKPGSIAWCMLAGITLSKAFNSGSPEAGRLSEMVAHTQPELDAIPAYVEALLYPLGAYGMRGARQEAARMLSRMMEAGTSQPEHASRVSAMLSYSQGFFGCYFEHRLWRAFAHSEQAIGPLRAQGHERLAALALVAAARALAAMGDFPGAAKRFHDALAISQHEGERRLHDHVRTHATLALAWSFEEAQREEARESALEMVKEGTAHPLMMGRMFVALSKLAGEHGHWHEAEAHARKACELLTLFPPTRVLAHAVLSTCLLAQGRVREAREEARLGIQELEKVGGAGIASVRGYLAMAEACFASGDTEEGDAALLRALQNLRAQHQDIPDSEHSRLLLHRVPENARVLEWARQRWGTHGLGTGE